MRTLAIPRYRLEIQQRLSQVRADSVRRWGRMTAHQMVCHLGDCFRMALAHRSVSPARGLLPQVMTKWIALYLPLPWPRGVIETRPDEGLAFIDRMSMRYTGQPYRFRGADREIFVIDPDHVIASGGR